MGIFVLTSARLCARWTIADVDSQAGRARVRDTLAPSAGELSAGRLSPNDVVSFDDRGHAQARFAVFKASLSAHNLSLRAYKDISAPGDFRRQRQGDVEIRTCFQIAADDEIQSSSGDISRSAILPGHQALRGKSNGNR